MASNLNYPKTCKYNRYHNSYCSNCSREDFQAMAERTLDMKREEDRLRTYDNWSYERIQNPSFLAKAGLYYTGIGDRVQCPFCHGVLKKWERSDIPYNEHCAHFSYCRFIRGYDVGNVPLEDPSPVNYHNTPSASNNIGNGNNRSHNYNVINNHDVNYNNCNFHNGTSPTTPAVNIIPQCTDEAVSDLEEYLKTEFNRLRTFSTWPPNLPQTPETLSEAGFYHVPTDEKPDRVKCAYCQGKLFNWQENDDPWIEHARCFPECPYVGLCMGKDVVRELLANEEPEVPIENGSSENGPDVVPAQTPPTQFPTQPAREGRTTDDTVAVRMTSEPVQAVLEMGFDNDLVTQTVEKCLRERPGNFPPAEELASMVMELEEEVSAPAEAAAPLTPLQRMMSNGRRGENDYQAGVPGTPEQRTNTFEATQINNVVSNGKKGGQNGTARVNVDRIRSENSKMKDQLLCKICMENLVRVTFMPCGHLVCCGPCSMTMSECPICRASITGCVRTYF